MTRPLIALDASEPARVFAALRIALAADGPAILPRDRSVDAEETASGSGLLPVQVEKRVAVVIETSGSTGTPKRVALSADALLASAAASESALGGPGQWLLALPAHYIAGVNVLVRSIAAQTEPVLLPPGHFDATGFVTAADRMDAALRFTSVVPAQLARVVDLAASDAAALATLRRFDRILVGGQATPPGVLERAASLGLRVTRTYGSSETSGGCIYDGVPIGTAAVRIREGQIELSGPMLAEGYLSDPKRTAVNFHTDESIRWYRTGDTGELVEGVLRVTGRLDRVIISGGIKVSLDGIENLLRTLPGLSDAVAVAEESVEWGEVPVIVSTVPSDLGALRSAMVASLGRAAAPNRVVLVESIPVLASGKPDRIALGALVGSQTPHVAGTPHGAETPHIAENPHGGNGEIQRGGAENQRAPDN